LAPLRTDDEAFLLKLRKRPPHSALAQVKQPGSFVQTETQIAVVAAVEATTKFEEDLDRRRAKAAPSCMPKQGIGERQKLAFSFPLSPSHPGDAPDLTVRASVDSRFRQRGSGFARECPDAGRSNKGAPADLDHVQAAGIDQFVDFRAADPEQVRRFGNRSANGLHPYPPMIPRLTMCGLG
jgi:hypothetical protein